jgi:hypothetical protein
MALLLNSIRLRINPGWPNAGSLQERLNHVTYRYRGQDTGAYRINGTVKVDGSPDTPVARKVVLFDQVGLRPLQDTFSNATTGEYEFTHLANKPHMVMAFDHTNNFRAVVADRVTPEPMP